MAHGQTVLEELVGRASEPQSSILRGFFAGVGRAKILKDSLPHRRGAQGRYVSLLPGAIRGAGSVIAGRGHCFRLYALGIAAVSWDAAIFHQRPSEGPAYLGGERSPCGLRGLKCRLAPVTVKVKGRPPSPWALGLRAPRAIDAHFCAKSFPV